MSRFQCLIGFPLTGAQCCCSICLSLCPPVLLHLEEGWGSLGLGFQMNQDGGWLSSNPCSPLYVWSEGMAVNQRTYLSGLVPTSLLISCGLGRVWSGGEELDSGSRYSGPVADRGLVLEDRPLPGVLLSYPWADLFIFPCLCHVFVFVWMGSIWQFTMCFAVIVASYPAPLLFLFLPHYCFTPFTCSVLIISFNLLFSPLSCALLCQIVVCTPCKGLYQPNCPMFCRFMLKLCQQIF